MIVELVCARFHHNSHQVFGAAERNLEHVIINSFAPDSTPMAIHSAILDFEIRNGTTIDEQNSYEVLSYSNWWDRVVERKLEMKTDP